MKSRKLPHVHLYLISGIHLVLALCTASVFAGELHLAVAANFTQPLKQHLKPQFETDSGHRLIISFGGTGHLYTQIKYGAPFDLFLAADMKRPEKLVSEGLAGSLFTYAEGQLVLWSPDADIVDSNEKVLSTGKFKHLAIAHPKMAPYGAAAKQVLEKLGLWKRLQRQRQIVRGNNVSQAYQFTATGNAQLGFIALSQYQATPESLRGSHWLVPKNLYSPIRQGAVLLKRGQNNPAAKAFIAFLQSDSARQIIEKLGYVVP